MEENRFNLHSAAMFFLMLLASLSLTIYSSPTHQPLVDTADVNDAFGTNLPSNQTY